MKLIYCLQIYNNILSDYFKKKLNKNQFIGMISSIIYFSKASDVKENEHLQI